MLGLSPYDTDDQINTYKQQNGITNPCAGAEGGAHEAIQIVIDGQNFYGYPTYSVVCPDEKLLFGVCFPPTPECFDPFISSCGATSTSEFNANDFMVEVYPNPASSIINIELSSVLAGTYEIFNLMGEKTSEGYLSSTDARTMVPVSELQGGIYFLRIETLEGVLTKKISVR